MARRYLGKTCARRRARKCSHHTSQIITLETHASTRCSNKMPFSFYPSSWNCHARMPVARTGNAEIAAASRL